MPTAVLVMGMHRSGTSAVAGALALAGVDLGSNLTPPREENPRGFFEHDDVWQLHQRLLRDLGSEWDDVRALPPQWPEGDAAKRAGAELFKLLSNDFAASSLWGVKDPRLSRLFPLWPPILRRLDAEPRIVLSLRHPLESARSIVRRDGLDLSHALGSWLRYTLDAELATRGYRRAVQHYPELLSDWRGALLRIERALDLGLAAPSGEREKEIASFLEIDLRHHHAEESWPGPNCPMPLAEWCDKVYRAMLQLPDAGAAATIDWVAASLTELESRALPFSAQIRDQAGQIGDLRSAISHLESDRGRRGPAFEHLEAECTRLRSAVERFEQECVRLSESAHQHDLRAQQAERARRHRDADLLVSRARIEALETQIRELRSNLARGQEELHDAHTKLDDAHIKLDDSRRELVDARTQLHAVHRSRSWRVTRPVRAVSHRLRALRAGLKRPPEAPRTDPLTALPGAGLNASMPAPPPSPERPAGFTEEISLPLRPERSPAMPAGRLRILIATPDLHGPIRNGGIGTAFSELARWLSGAGHRVTVLYTFGRFSEAEPIEHWQFHYRQHGVEVVPLPEGDEVTIEASHCAQDAWRVHAWLRTRQADYDLVIFPEWSGVGYYVALARDQGLAYDQLRIAVNAHSPESWALEGNHVLPDYTDLIERDFIERESVRRADWVISPSRYLLDWMQQRKWALPARSKVIPNILADGSEPDVASRNTHEVKGVVFFGRLEMRKGLGLFCDAIDRMPQEARSRIQQIVFMGKLVSRSGFSSLPYIEQRAASWNVPVEVRADLNRDQALEALRAPGLLAVIASLSENSPYTVVECLCHGIVFLATCVGGIPELVDPRDHAATLFEPNPSALVDRLASVLEKGAYAARPALSQEHIRSLWSSWLEEVVAERAGVNVPATTPAEPAAPHPKVSICLVHHERPQLLGQALDSLRGQTYQNFEVVLVDDGSKSEGALTCLTSLEPEFGLRDWRIIRQPNCYLGAARNRAAEAASGDYLLFMDDDNIATSGEIETFVKVALRTGADVLTSAAFLFEGDAPPEKADRLWVPLGGALGAGVYRNVFGDANALWRREAFLALRGYTTDYGIGYEDWELFAEALLRGLKLELVPEPLFHYRITSGSMMRTGDRWTNHARSARAFLRNDPNGLGLACAYARALLLIRTEPNENPVPKVRVAE